MRILAVDDQAEPLAALTAMLESEHEVTACRDSRRAESLLRARRFDLVFLDLCMPPPDGFALLDVAMHLDVPPPVVIVTATDSATSAVRALRAGAVDYLVKPFKPDDLEALLARLTHPPASDRGTQFGIVGVSPAVAELRRLIPLLAGTDESVLILGETGTGKELLARALHEAGPRAGGPFVAHNMAATPHELAESLFFGHVQGAFSGARDDHPGLFEQASGGTLYLDEIDSLPLDLQAKLLRALETRSVRRVGSTHDRDVDVRVLASSAIDLEEAIATGTFRADLYYRLHQLDVRVPPLRERPEDIEPLARHFLECDAGPEAAPLTAPVLDALRAYPWPGNVRELRNALRSARVLAAGGPIALRHLPRSLRAGGSSGDAAAPTRTLAEAERDHIRHVLEACGGNRSEAARRLGIDRGTLARKLREA